MNQQQGDMIIYQIERVRSANVGKALPALGKKPLRKVPYIWKNLGEQSLRNREQCAGNPTGGGCALLTCNENDTGYAVISPLNQVHQQFGHPSCDGDYKPSA